jgi:hypothetical protein
METKLDLACEVDASRPSSKGRSFVAAPTSHSWQATLLTTALRTPRAARHAHFGRGRIVQIHQLAHFRMCIRQSHQRLK